MRLRARPRQSLRIGRASRTEARGISYMSFFLLAGMRSDDGQKAAPRGIPPLPEDCASALWAGLAADARAFHLLAGAPGLGTAGGGCKRSFSGAAATFFGCHIDGQRGRACRRRPSCRLQRHEAASAPCSVCLSVCLVWSVCLFVCLVCRLSVCRS